MELSLKEIQKIKNEFPPGTKVRCKYMDDPYHPVPSGTLGSVDKVDDSGTIHVIWENGSYLGLIYGVDSFEKTITKTKRLKKEMSR